MKCFTAISVFFSITLSFSAQATISQRAWAACQPTYKKILQHKFIQQLGDGTLDPKIFCYYMKMDSEYLNADGRSFALLAGRVLKPSQSLTLLDFSRGAFEYEQKTVHDNFYKSLCHTIPKGRTPALVAYSSYLSTQSSLASPAVAMSSLLPCFWVYHEVGKELLKNSKKNNRYQRWINAYADEGMKRELERARNLLDELAEGSSFDEQEKIIYAFDTSCKLEWQFWDDAYYLRNF